MPTILKMELLQIIWAIAGHLHVVTLGMPWPNRKSYRLVDLAHDSEIDEGKAHRALEDARRALFIYAGAVSVLKAIA